MIRRYAPLKASRGTQWPSEVRAAAYRLHRGCLGPRVGMPKDCFGAIELDHIRSSGGISMKSRSTLDNAASLCSTHHRVKTDAGKRWRPLLIELVDRLIAVGHTHVELVHGCLECEVIRLREQVDAIRPRSAAPHTRMPRA